MYTVAVQAESEDGEDELGDAEGEEKVEHFCGGMGVRWLLGMVAWDSVCGVGMWGACACFWSFEYGR